MSLLRARVTGCLMQDEVGRCAALERGRRKPEAPCRRRSNRILEAVIVKKMLGVRSAHLVQQIAHAGESGITAKKDVAAALEQIFARRATKEEIVRRRTPDKRCARALKLFDGLTADANAVDREQPIG